MRVLAHQAWLQPIGRQPIGVAMAGGALVWSLGMNWPVHCN